MTEIALLVKAGLVQAEGVDDIENLFGRVLGALLSFLSGGVGADVYAGGQRAGLARRKRGRRIPMFPTPMVILRQSAS